MIIAGERPVLEYAGWLATAAQEHGLTGQLQVHIVESRDSLRARLGASAMDIIALSHPERRKAAIGHRPPQVSLLETILNTLPPGAWI